MIHRSCLTIKVTARPELLVPMIGAFLDAPTAK
jgi:hypothetical protein